MADQYVGKAEIYINGRLQAEAKSVQLTVNSNDTQVGTIINGFAGFSDGAGNTEATIDSAVPLAGFEKSFHKAVVNKETITLVVKMNKADKIRAVGRFQSAQFSSSFNGETTISGTFLGGKAKFE